ncbi:MAG: phosphoadenosine phosphosulfate reductase family protein [Lachnospiraceae bacterium]|nr:phosphoadenosine phosphosulfate reductase family protein [Lachnospiraceae bacterium]
MLSYRCKLHNIPLKTSTCLECGTREHVEVKSNIYWCDICNVPIYERKCSVCGTNGKRVASDLRPVFPEERLLLEIIWGEPFKYKDSSVWNTSGNYYLIDGKLYRFSVAGLRELDTDAIRTAFNTYEEVNYKNSFEKYVDKFIECNKDRYTEIDEEALRYLQEVTMGYDARDMFVSFSGGKDSTVTSDLVIRALGNPKILHIFGDTTLEFPETESYVANFKKKHSSTPVISSRNKEKNFEDLCQLIGPPSRVMRWCCTIFKTGAISRKISALFKGKTKILAFYGIRRSESASRSKYDRESEGHKISKQVTISPIIDWLDFDIWLYLLTRKIDFNSAYRLGYSRVGCWCCPNNSAWSEFLSKIHMKEQYEHWHTILVDFAKSIGKLDAEEYIDTGKWKARQGGNGVNYAKKSVISFEPCVLEENAFNYELQRPITEDLYELFKPFGYINTTLGNERLGEVYILKRDGEPILKLQGRMGSTHLKVTIFDYKLDGALNLAAAEDKVKCQLTKYQMCMGCRACEGVCKFGAIRMETLADGEISYRIADEKCVRCKACVNHFIAGCYMRKVLATKR